MRRRRHLPSWRVPVVTTYRDGILQGLQIFHDPTGRRERRVRYASALIAMVALMAAVIGLYAVLNADRVAAPALRATPAVARPVPQQPLAPIQSVGRPATHAPEGNTPESFGFYMPWDEAARRSLSAHADKLDWVVGGLARVEGRSHQFSYESDAHLGQVLRDTARAPRLLVMVQNVDADGNWDGAGTAALVAHPTQRAAFLARVEQMLDREHAAGVTFDFEALPPGSHAAYRTFLQEAQRRLSKHGRLVTLAVPVADPAWDLAAYGRVADRLFVMAYDEHWPGGEPGPIASQSWFEDNIRKATQAIGPDKTVIAIGSYAYDWSNGKGTGLPIEQAWQNARKAGKLPQFDPASRNSHFAYTEGKTRHEVWTLDAASAWNHLVAARRQDVAGVALWRMGSEDAGFWSALSAPSRSQPDLRTLPVQTALELEGQGEVLRVSGVSTPGRREVAFDADGTIGDLRYHALPAPDLVQRAGHQRRLVALTFDDGPDPRWTPQILDILKRSGAPATFFVTGNNVLGQQALLTRILAEGSELGNHSTTHPDLDLLSEDLVKLELNVTHRLVESYTGRSMRLFRPPYLGDADPNTQQEVRVARMAGDMGYLTVGLNVDPLDWAFPGADAIVAKAVAQVESGGPDRATQVILLHDSGGDRTQTIDALPRLIAALRARGYEFVTVSRLAGLSSNQVMPKVTGRTQLTASGIFGAFLGISALVSTVSVLFVLAIALGLSRSIILTTLAVRAARREVEPDPQPHLVPSFVSVLIPAFNEERVIEASVRHILSSRGPRIEVIIIDDGSSDGTSAVVTRAFGIDPRIRLLTLPNGGKAHALNQGLRIAKGDIVVALDADTRFEPDTIARLVRWFADPCVGAVAGNARVGNVINLVTRWQQIEYVTAQNLERRALSALDAITVVPGAVGAWRRATLDVVGGFPSDTLAEDQDLTIAVQQAGWKVICDNRAIAWTEAPQSFRALFKQRYRWAFGTLQCLWKHRSLLRSGKPRGLAHFGLPQTWVFQIGFGLISPVIDLALFTSIAGYGLRLATHGMDQSEGSLLKIAAFWSVFTAVDLLCCQIAYRLDANNQRVPFLRLLLQRFGYRQLLYAVIVRAVFAALCGPKVGWGKLERSGRHTAAPALPEVADLMPTEPDFVEPRQHHGTVCPLAAA